MTRPRFIIYILTVILSACHTQNEQSIERQNNDTTKVIELAIRTAFHGYLPDVSALKRKYYFKDSILLATKLSLHYEIPSRVDTLLFKHLSEDEICTIIKGDISNNPPNYLCIQSFEKNDSGYKIMLASLSCLPFEGGGSMGLDIVKRNDSFFIKKKMAFSIN
jgi:hypothetical protein